MFKYILVRVLLLFLVVFLALTIVFFLQGLIKDYPLKQQPGQTDADFQALLEGMGLKDPIGTRYTTYLKGIFTKGDFGLYYNKPSTSIPSLFFRDIKYTLMVTGPAFAISSVLGVSLGFIAGYKEKKIPDIAVNIFVTIFIAIPSFVLASFAYLISSVPQVGISSVFVRPDLFGSAATWKSVIMPIAILSLLGLASLTYFTRNEVILVLNSEYVKIARAKGMNWWQVFTKYVFRNCAAPLVYVMIVSFVSILVGGIIIERFWGVPGISSTLVEAITQREVNITSFSIIFVVTISLTLNLVAELMMLVLDPRIRYVASSSGSSRVKRWIARYQRNRGGKNG